MIASYFCVMISDMMLNLLFRFCSLRQSPGLLYYHNKRIPLNAFQPCLVHRRSDIMCNIGQLNVILVGSFYRLITFLLSLGRCIASWGRAVVARPSAPALPSPEQTC